MVVCDCEDGSHADDEAYEGSNLSVSPCHWAKPSVSTLLILWKHLPAFAGLYFIFPFIVPGFLYGKLGTSLSTGFTLKRPWDWQTNKQTALKTTKPVGRHYDGGIVSPSHTFDHCVLFFCHERLCECRRSWLIVEELLDSGLSVIFFLTEPAQFILFMIHLFEMQNSCLVLRLIFV